MSDKSPSTEPTVAHWIDLANERVDGRVLWANDDFFAEKENLVRAPEAVWDEDRYTDRGKWMDGWESRRRREPGHDTAIVQLGLPGVIREIVVDTAHFTGNYPEGASVEACWAPPDTSTDELVDPDGPWSDAWIEIVPESLLEGHTKNRFAVDAETLFSHVRLHIYPDGGVARLRVFGEVVVEVSSDSCDLASLVQGGSIADASDRYFSAPENLLLPHASTGMHDGWETRRRRGPGNDWVVVRLGAVGTLERVVVDTSHFKGNAPGWFSLEGLAPGVGYDAEREGDWISLLEKTDLQPDREHVFGVEHSAAVDHVRLQIYPDGGVARLRLFGTAAEEVRVERAVDVLDRLPRSEAERRLLGCCGSTRWAERVLEQRPFASCDRLYECAEAAWRELDGEAWLEAFSAHPRIGERKAPQATGERAANWSRGEQFGVQDAGEEVLLRLTHANRRYEERFGHVFLVCATGKSADEMLEILESRIDNEPERELEIAATEQAKITRLRLEKLLRE